MKGNETTVRDEVIDDALNALAVLRKQKEVDPRRTYVIGHSLGGCLAPAIGSEDASLAGLVILSGTLRPMEDVILDQLTYIASLEGEGQKESKEALEKVRPKVEAFSAGKARPDDKILGAPVSYWKDLSGYLGPRGQKMAKAFDRPILIMGGGRDYQITKKDF